MERTADAFDAVLRHDPARIVKSGEEDATGRGVPRGEPAGFGKEYAHA